MRAVREVAGIDLHCASPPVDIFSKSSWMRTVGSLLNLHLAEEMHHSVSLLLFAVMHYCDAQSFLPGCEQVAAVPQSYLNSFHAETALYTKAFKYNISANFSIFSNGIVFYGGGRAEPVSLC